MSLAVIPLAITMNAGPQIMSALIFVTASAAEALGLLHGGRGDRRHRWRHYHLHFSQRAGNSVSLGDPSDSGSIGKIIQYVLVGLLVILSIRSYLTRATSEPPRWLGAMQNAKPRTAFWPAALDLPLPTSSS